MKEPKRKNKPGAGRPRIEVNEELIYSLARIFCTQEEISTITGVSVDTLHRNYADVIKKGNDNGRMSLRRKQFQSAIAGNTTMLIWLGKNLLGQKDSPLQLSNPDEGKGIFDDMAAAMQIAVSEVRKPEKLKVIEGKLVQ